MTARWLTGLLWLLAALILTALAVVVTGPCALSLPGQDRPWLSFCPAPPALADDADAAARLALERNRTATLEDRLRRLEVRLAAGENDTVAMADLIADLCSVARGFLGAYLRARRSLGQRV